MFSSYSDIVAVNGQSFTLRLESEGDLHAREVLLDLTMGEGRRRKSSEAIRRGRLPADQLAFVVTDLQQNIVATLRLWHVHFGRDKDDIHTGLLLGPLAVHPDVAGCGLGSALMRQAIESASRLGHGAIFLVGDPDYYQRFGFSSVLTKTFAMPGPYEKHRFQALELIEGHLDGCHGVLAPAGMRASARKTREKQVA